MNANNNAASGPNLDRMRQPRKEISSENPARRREQHRAMRAVEETQAGQLGPQRPVVAYGGEFVPGVQPHGWVEPGGVSAAGRRAGVAAGGLIGEHEFEERHMREVSLAGQDQPLGQGVKHRPEFELAHDALEFG